MTKKPDFAIFGHSHAPTQMLFAMPEWVKTMEREGMRSGGMLCYKRVSDGHIGVGQARWNSKKVSAAGLYNGMAYITVRSTQ